MKWDFEAAIPYAEQAIAYAKAHDHKDVLCHAYNNLACSLRWDDSEHMRSFRREHRFGERNRQLGRRGARL
jgi:hypothetical protein